MKNIHLILSFTTLLAACNPYHYDDSSYIEMKKDPCFGFCPVYTFKVDGAGKATFNGDRNVDKEGAWARTLPPGQTNALFKAFEDGNFWDFKDEYTDQVTDLPTTYTTFSHRGQTKKIKDYYGAPEELKTLEKLLEDIAETKEGWVQSNGQ